MNEIALACADYALNSSADILYTNIPTDVTVYFSNITNDDSLSILRDIGYQADCDMSTGHYYNFRSCTAEIRAIVSGTVAKLTVNGDADIYTGFEALEPPWKADGDAGDSFIIDPAWLDENGMFRVKGTPAHDTNYAELNGAEPSVVKIDKLRS